MIRAARAAGTIVPRFCDHGCSPPRGVPSVPGRGGRPAQAADACTTTVTDGMESRPRSPPRWPGPARRATSSAADQPPRSTAPVRQGGECPPQDQTLAHGPARPARRDQAPLPEAAQDLARRSCSTGPLRACAAATASPQRSPATPSSSCSSGCALSRWPSTRTSRREPLQRQRRPDLPGGALTSPSSGSRPGLRPDSTDAVCNP